MKLMTAKKYKAKNLKLYVIDPHPNTNPSLISMSVHAPFGAAGSGTAAVYIPFVPLDP